MKIGKPKRTYIRLLLLLCILFAGEAILRFLYGFCDAPLFVSSSAYEYIAAANQDGERFGNHYHFNSYSQRSNEPDTTKTIILGLGDSVLLGGVQTDQDSIATSIFTAEMPNYQMLNIAAGSWGPDNCLAYIKEKGTFNAKALFLVVSSHDAYDNMDFEPVVGLHPSYPSKQYGLAYLELLDRYVLPRVKKLFTKEKKLDPDQKVLDEIQKEGTVFNPGFDGLKHASDSLNIPLTLYLHAEKSELANTSYNEQGQQIIQWAKDNGVTLIEELDYNFSDADYRDKIHINGSGQKKLAQIMLETYQ